MQWCVHYNSYRLIFRTQYNTHNFWVKFWHVILGCKRRTKKKKKKKLVQQNKAPSKSCMEIKHQWIRITTAALVSWHLVLLFMLSIEKVQYKETSISVNFGENKNWMVKTMDGNTWWSKFRIWYFVSLRSDVHRLVGAMLLFVRGKWSNRSKPISWRQIENSTFRNAIYFLFKRYSAEWKNRLNDADRPYAHIE